MESKLEQAIRRAKSLLHSASDVAVLTGAGMSAESGIPTFRQAVDSLWATYSLEELATPRAWRRDPALVWGWYLWRMARVRAALPNAGHRALAKAAAKRELHVITQNVDDLHERAGSRGVVHLHGSLFAHRCFACARPHADVVIPDAASAPLRVEPPRCAHCGGRVRPGVVWFGESLPREAWEVAADTAKECDLMLVIGTSGIVHPAAMLPGIARQAGAKIVEINPVSTELVDANVTIRGTAANMLPQLVRPEG